MFGYACNDTPELMPLPIALAHRILNRLTVPGDAASQLVASRQQEPGHGRVRRRSAARVDTVVVSTQHGPDVKQDEIRQYVINKVVRPTFPRNSGQR